MPRLEIEGRLFEVDRDGFLQEPDIWDEEVARLFATTDGTGRLTEKHWTVVKYIREHWEKTGRAPRIRRLCKHTELRLKEIYDLFPMGPAKGACRIAGLPKPDGCV